MEAEVHIAGVLVHARNGRARVVAEALHGRAGMEVRAVSDDGKLVVVCDCESGEAVLALVAQMRDLPDVVDVALVYQHSEPVGAMNEEVGNAIHQA